MIAERGSQTCGTCGNEMKQEFTPPTIFMTPEAFRHSFSELFGTTSEKDYLKANPHAVKVSPSTFRSRRQQDEARWAKAHVEAADVEHALKANATLTAPRGVRKKKGTT